MGARRYQVHRRVDAPAATAWALLTDADSYRDWNPSVVSIEGPIVLGGTVRLVSEADPGRTFRLRVDELEAPHRMVWSSGMPLGLFRGRRTFTLEDQADGRCEFAMVEEFTGPLAGLITRSIPDLTESFERFADGLADAVRS